MVSRADVPMEHAAKRRAIIDGAAAVFARRGFAAGTTKEIAAEVDLTQPAIYHYVGSKSDLLREIAMQVNDDMLAALEQGVASADGPRDQLRAVLERFTAAVVTDRDSFAVFWQESHALAEEIRNQIAGSQREFIRQVGHLVSRLQETGDLPAGPPTVVAEAILSMPSWMYHWYQPGGRLNAVEVSDLYCSLIGLDR